MGAESMAICARADKCAERLKEYILETEKQKTKLAKFVQANEYCTKQLLLL